LLVLLLVCKKYRCQFVIRDRRKTYNSEMEITDITYNVDPNDIVHVANPNRETAMVDASATTSSMNGSITNNNNNIIINDSSSSPPNRPSNYIVNRRNDEKSDSSHSNNHVSLTAGYDSPSSPEVSEIKIMGEADYESSSQMGIDNPLYS